MPQLDPSSFASQLFWLTISFVMLYLVLARFLLPRVQSVLEFRSYTIGGDIKQAERMKSEAEKARQDYEKSLFSARKRAQSLLTDARDAMVARSANSLAALDATLNADMAQSEVAIAGAKQVVIQKLTPVAEELAGLIVEMLVQEKPAAKDIHSAVAGIGGKA